MSTLRQFWRHYRRTSGARHELLALGLSLGLGLVVMPALVWIVGSWKLGPYANGGPFALWRDYLVALFHGSIPYWLVALGPYFGLWLLRAARIAIHR
ncbi:MAG TPA: hypothetical protein VK130_11340 [Steroidobacteraceae bacterium]|nr:hypothetical protein [Steroidobacteraceae bacterium]